MIVVERTNFTGVVSENYTNISANIAKEGYIPIGVSGIYSGLSTCTIISFGITSDNNHAFVILKNHANASQEITDGNFNIIYIKKFI